MIYDRAKLYFEVTFSLTSPSQILSSLLVQGMRKEEIGTCRVLNLQGSFSFYSPFFFNSHAVMCFVLPFLNECVVKISLMASLRLAC